MTRTSQSIIFSGSIWYLKTRTAIIYSNLVSKWRCSLDPNLEVGDLIRVKISFFRISIKISWNIDLGVFYYWPAYIFDLQKCIQSLKLLWNLKKWKFSKFWDFFEKLENSKFSNNIDKHIDSWVFYSFPAHFSDI